MLAPFFALAFQSPSRQRSWRRIVVLHLALLGGMGFALRGLAPDAGRQALGSALLIAGIVEGAWLVGWRLTQLPKSQALEFLLVSPLRPAGVLLAEAAVGLTLLLYVTLSGLPILLLMTLSGVLDPLDLLPLLLMPFTWGALTGLGLTVWAYEPLGVRRVGERLSMAAVVLYLVIGVLAGENLRHWVTVLPESVARAVLRGFARFHTHNPFGVMKFWMESNVGAAWERFAGLQTAALLLLVLLAGRAAWRLQSHFHELHYQPMSGPGAAQRGAIGDWPLSWWAVKRVRQYAGRINFWLAGGFGALYAAYILAGDLWPAWMGRRVFELADGAGGVAGLTTGLVLLAAVPAAFQYGLWDSSVQDRCRRLELLLLTDLQPRDYWTAAAAAAWQRGWGYFAIACGLWGSAVLAGRLSPIQALAAVAAGVLLWGLYFALGFRAFSRSQDSNGLGSLLTLGLPLLVYALYQMGWPTLAGLLPPGAVYQFGRGAPWADSLGGLTGPALCALAALALARRALADCDATLRRWYDRHVGSKVLT